MPGYSPFIKRFPGPPETIKAAPPAAQPSLDEEKVRSIARSVCDERPGFRELEGKIAHILYTDQRVGQRLAAIEEKEAAPAVDLASVWNEFAERDGTIEGLTEKISSISAGLDERVAAIAKKLEEEKAKLAQTNGTLNGKLATITVGLDERVATIAKKLEDEKIRVQEHLAQINETIKEKIATVASKLEETNGTSVWMRAHVAVGEIDLCKDAGLTEPFEKAFYGEQVAVFGPVIGDSVLVRRADRDNGRLVQGFLAPKYLHDFSC